MSEEAQDVYTDLEHAKFYLKFRPSYSDTVLDKILEFCKENGACFDVAVDVGCGSGQSTIPLARAFKQVIGVDISAAQISNAPKDVANISFEVSPGEDLHFVRDGSVDLVTVATALHYLDHTQFFREVDRVLKPSGCLIAYCYSVPHLSNQEADVYFHGLMDTIYDQTWTEREKIILNKCNSVKFPYASSKRDETLKTSVECTLEDFMGFLNSCTFVRKLQRQEPERQILDEIRENLLKCVTEEEGLNTRVTMTYPVFMVMCCKTA